MNATLPLSLPLSLSRSHFRGIFIFLNRNYLSVSFLVSIMKNFLLVRISDFALSNPYD